MVVIQALEVEVLRPQAQIQSGIDLHAFLLSIRRGQVEPGICRAWRLSVPPRQILTRFAARDPNQKPGDELSRLFPLELMMRLLGFVPLELVVNFVKPMKTCTSCKY
jgi:hypothetical protein